MKIQNFTDLISWSTAHSLVIRIYEICKKFLSEEKFGLISQMKRSSVSVTSNIAEGFSRRTKNEKKNFYFIAKGSLTELENQIILSKDLGFIDEKLFKEILNLIISTKKLLTGLIKTTLSYYN